MQKPSLLSVKRLLPMGRRNFCSLIRCLFFSFSPVTALVYCLQGFLLSMVYRQGGCI